MRRCRRSSAPQRTITLVAAAVLAALAAWSSSAAGRGTAPLSVRDTYARPEVLVDVAWLAARVGDPRVRIVDARMPFDRALYEAGHIPGAVFVNVFEDVWPVAEIMPSAAFAAAMARFGIGNDTTVVVYDTDGGTWAARLWWALRLHGHEDVRMLSGGLRQWIHGGQPLADEPPEVAAAEFRVNVEPRWLASTHEVRAAIDDPEVALVDALPWPYHAGDVVAYGRPGHIPNALNLPAPDTVDVLSLEVLSPQALSRMIARLGLDPRRRTIVYCGGGYYAAHIVFILYLMGFDDVALYDASLIAWASDPNNPLETVP